MSGISIHTLRVEGDIIRNYFMNEFFPISIHTLRVEGDHIPQRQQKATK